VPGRQQAQNMMAMPRMTCELLHHPGSRSRGGLAKYAQAQASSKSAETYRFKGKQTHQPRCSNATATGAISANCALK
jgi:hypothetical protein